MGAPSWTLLSHPPAGVAVKESVRKRSIRLPAGTYNYVSWVGDYPLLGTISPLRSRDRSEGKLMSGEYREHRFAAPEASARAGSGLDVAIREGMRCVRRIKSCFRSLFLAT